MALETDKQGGFEYDASQLLRTGVFPGRFDRRVPLWKSVDGVEFDEFGMRRRAGRDELANVGSEVIRGITAVNEFGTKVAYFGDLSNLYSYRLDDSSTNTVGTGFDLTETASATSWDSGSTTWDSGATVWDEDVNSASQWSFVTFGSWVLATNDVDRPQIKKSNVNFNDLYTTQVSGATVNAGGSGYAVDDTIVMTGGSGTGFDVTVTEVDSGAVVAFEVTDFGASYTDGNTLTQSSTSGSGTGFTCDVTVPDAPFTQVKIFKKLGPHVLAINYEKTDASFPTSFAWCSADDVDTWVAASTNTAGSLQIREAETGLRSAAYLGGSLAVYTKNQMFFVSYVGLPNIFGYQPAVEGVGAVSVNSTVSANRLNYGLCEDGFFLTDGSQVEWIGRENGMDQYIQENVSATEYPQVVGYHDGKNNQVCWSVPLGNTQNTHEIYYNYRTTAWGIRAGNISACFDRGVFDSPLTGDNEGRLYAEGAVADVNNGSSVTFAQSNANDLGDADRYKEISSVRIGKTGNGIPGIQFAGTDLINDTPVFGDMYFMQEDFSEIFPRVAGRYIHMKINGSGASDSWQITDMVFQGRLEGVL